MATPTQLPSGVGTLVPTPYGAVRVMMDGAYTAIFDECATLLLALAWMAAPGAVAAVVCRRITVSGPGR